jgi:hypothetical protein
MQLPKEAVGRFQQLCKNRFGEDMTEKEACEQGTQLINLLRIIYRPMTEQEYSQLQKSRELKKLNCISI